MQPYYSDGAVTLYHGDCREVLPTLAADVTITDPPYGQTSLAWDRWVTGWLDLIPDAPLWCFGSLRMFMDRAGEFTAAGWHLAQDVVWRKHNGSSFHNDRFRRIHEQVAHFYRGEWAEQYRDVQTTPDATPSVVRHKCRPTHMGVMADNYRSEDGGPRLMLSVIEARSEHGRAEHPTQKPLGIVSPLIAYSCPPEGTVLDAFAGSGTTLVAAKNLGRRAIGIEVDERYCEIAARRLSQEILPLGAAS